MRALVLRLEAPLMSFGRETIDERGVIGRFPGLSLITGLLANALGYDQADSDAHERLQARLRFACRIDRPGEQIVDYQTASIRKGERAWTTHGVPGERAGGTYETVERERHYHADSSCMVTLMLEPPDEAPTLDDLAAALEKPARPLFIGRKCCLPTEPFYGGFIKAKDLSHALRRVPAEGPRRSVPAQWPIEEETSVSPTTIVSGADTRDWRNQVHTGERLAREGLIEIGGEGP